MPLTGETWPFAQLVFLLVLGKLIGFLATGLYQPVLRYAGLELLLTASKAVLCGFAFLIGLAYLPEPWQVLKVPQSVLIIDALLTLSLVVSLRLSLRWLISNLSTLSHPNNCLKRVVIYGAGAAGSEVAQALTQSETYRLVAFIDDDPDLRNRVIQGLRVYPAKDLPKLLRQRPFDMVLLAMPSIHRRARQQILVSLQALCIPVKTIPSFREILSGEVSINTIRNVEVKELLGREEVPPDPDLLHLNLTGKSVLVTGAGGSIGSELCRQIAQQAPKCLVMYEQNEFALYSIALEIAEQYPSLQGIACLGSVTDQQYFTTVLLQHKVDTIYHAAAYKHVPLVEENPAQGVLNNVLGTLVVARSAVNCFVSRFVLVSTDKAVRPTNVMGACKRVAELILQALADQPGVPTCFTIVRFGNVLGSSGSVVPRFRQQIAEGGPVTITHPEITRYFMLIPEAARLVIQAGAMGKGGEVFLLDMGEPVKIYDLALQMIRLSGLVPERDIEINITGLRPGEKLYEELLVDKINAKPTRHPKIFSACEPKLSWEILHLRLVVLTLKARCRDSAGILLELQRLVPEYQSAQILSTTSRMLSQPESTKH